MIEDNVKAMFYQEIQSRNNRTFLHIAADEGSVSVLQKMLSISKTTRFENQLKELLDVCDIDNYTALFLATKRGHVEICALLIKYGASISCGAKVETELVVLSRNDCSSGDKLVVPKLIQKRYSVRVPYYIDENVKWDNALDHFGYKFVVGCPMVGAYNNDGFYMYEIEVSGKTCGHPMFMGWTSDHLRRECTAKTWKFDNDRNEEKRNAVLDDLRYIYHIGRRPHSIGINLYSYQATKGDLCKDGWEVRSSTNDKFYVFETQEEIMDFSRKERISKCGESNQFTDAYAVFEETRSGAACFGTALDFHNKLVHFAVNGKWEALDAETSEDIFDSMGNGKNSKLYPAVSCAYGIVDIQFNFGQSDFKHPFRPEVGEISVTPVCEASVSVSPLLTAAKRQDSDCFSLLWIARLNNIAEFNPLNEVDVVSEKSLLHLFIDAYVASQSYKWIQFMREFFLPVNLTNEFNLCGNSMKRILNKKDNEGKTPLMHAAANGLDECVEILLGHGSSVETTGYVQTALMYAAEGGHIDCVKVLCSHFSSEVSKRNVNCQDFRNYLEVKDRHGKSAMEFASNDECKREIENWLKWIKDYNPHAEVLNVPRRRSA